MKRISPIYYHLFSTIRINMSINFKSFLSLKIWNPSYIWIVVKVILTILSKVQISRNNKNIFRFIITEYLLGCYLTIVSNNHENSGDNKSNNNLMSEAMMQMTVNDKDVIPEESKVGKKLSDLTTKRVIILVLAMLFCVPIFTASTYINDLDSTDMGLAIIDYFKNDTKSKPFKISIDTYTLVCKKNGTCAKKWHPLQKKDTCCKKKCHPLQKKCHPLIKSNSHNIKLYDFYWNMIYFIFNFL